MSSEVSTGWNCSFLSRQEYDDLISRQPLQIIQRAELKIKQLTQSLETVNAKSSTDRTNAEQLFQQLESNYIACKKDLDNQTQLNQKLKNDIITINNKNTELIEESTKYKQISIEKESKSNTLGKLFDDLHQEKTLLHGIIERKDKELKEEEETVSKLTERVNELIKSKAEMNAKILGLESEKTSTEYQMVRLKQEIAELKKQNDYIDQSCQKHTKAYYDELKELKSMLTEANSRADNLTDEKSRLENLLDISKKRVSDLEQTVEKHLNETKKLRDENVKVAGQFDHEIEIQKRLVTLYKDGQEEATKKVTSLSQQIDHLRQVDKSLREKHQEAYKKMEQAYDTLQEDYQRVCHESNELKQQLATRSNQPMDLSNMDIPLLQESAKRRIGEVSNLGNKDELRRELLDMVQRYDDLTKITLQERREKRFLQDNLEHVLREVEKKAPIIKEKNQEYHRLLKSQEKLLNNYQELQAEKDTLLLKISTLSSENNNQRHEVSDLQKQVRRLLKEALDKGGKNDKSLGGSMSASSTTAPTSMEEDQIIPDSLVTYSNIEELQMRNQELLRNIRNLGNQLALHQENDKKLEMAIQELEVLKSSRERQSKIIESLSSQRDYFKNVHQSGHHHMSVNNNDGPLSTSMLSSSNNSNKNQSSTLSSSGLDRSSSGNENELKKELEKIQKSYQELQKEYEEFIRERNSNEKSLYGKIDALKDQNTDLNIKGKQAESQIELLGERIKLLNDSVEQQKKEVESYRAKNQEYMTAIVRHQATMEEQRQQMNRLEEENRQSQIQYSTTRSQVEILKASETRLIEQNQSLVNEKRQIENILANVNAMVTAKENAELELRHKLETELNAQETNRIQLKKELDAERQANRDNQLQMQHQLSESRERFEKKEKEVTEWKEKCLKHKITEQTLSQKCSALEQQIATAEARFQSAMERNNQLRSEQQQHQQNSPTNVATSATVTSSISNATESDNLDLTLARSEIESLKESLAQEKDNVIHYKSIALSSESDLAKTKEEFTKVRVELEEKLREAQENESKYQQYLQEQSVKMEKMEHNSSSYKQDVDMVISERDNLLKEKQSLYAKIEELTKAQQMAINEASIQHELCKKATANYERELLLHAEDVKILPTLRSELTESKHTIMTLTSRAESAQKGLEVSQQSWNEQESLLKSQITEMEERIKDLKHQNNLLTSQIDSITSQSNRIDKMMSSVDVDSRLLLSQSDIANTNKAENERVISELRELVQVQSREQKILEVRNESLIQENSRLKQTIQQNQKQIDTLSLKNQELQDHLKSITFNSKKHEEVLKQLDQMNLFRESNIMLKDETSRLSRTIESLNARLKESEDMVSPLQQQNRKLLSENQVLRTDIEALKTEIGTWQGKVQKLLDKYQSIDPEVHQRIVEQYEQTKKEEEEVKKQLEDMKKHAKHWRDEAKKAQDQNTELKKEKTELESTRDQLKQQIESSTATKSQETEVYENQLAERKKLLSKAAKQIKDLKAENDTLKKSIEEKEKSHQDENNMLKSKLKVFETLKSKQQQQQQQQTLPATTTTTTVTPTTITPTPTTPTSTNVITPTPTPTSTTPASTTPVAATTITPPLSPFTQPPTDPTKKRIIRKPAATLINSLFDAKPPATTPTKPTPPPTTTTTTTPTTATPTTTSSSSVFSNIVSSIVAPVVDSISSPTPSTTIVQPPPPLASVFGQQPQPTSTTTLIDAPIGSPAQSDVIETMSEEPQPQESGHVEEIETSEPSASHSLKKQKISDDSVAIAFSDAEEEEGEEEMAEEDEGEIHTEHEEGEDVLEEDDGEIIEGGDTSMDNNNNNNNDQPIIEETPMESDTIATTSSTVHEEPTTIVTTPAPTTTTTTTTTTTVPETGAATPTSTGKRKLNRKSITTPSVPTSIFKKAAATSTPPKRKSPDQPPTDSSQSGGDAPGGDN